LKEHSMKPSNQVANVHMVETFGMFDGPGIRYVLFLQGCPFQCQFCHNRDSWSQDVNTLMSIDEILDDYSKYQSFYQKGGITVSGGEPLLQADFVLALFKKAKEKGIHTCLDTSAACFNPNKLQVIDQLLEVTDLVLLDIKHMDDDAHKILVGSSNKNVLAFAQYLNKKQVPTIIRHVLIPTINSEEIMLKQLRTFVDTLDNVLDIEILPYHSHGKRKWLDMGLEYPLEHILEPSKELLEDATRILQPFKANQNITLKKHINIKG
jgi:pyruvate formate lyase activating enzyme